jgi:hypothetical protein
MTLGQKLEETLSHVEVPAGFTGFEAFDRRRQTDVRHLNFSSSVFRDEFPNNLRVLPLSLILEPRQMAILDIPNESLVWNRF